MSDTQTADYTLKSMSEAANRNIPKKTAGVVTANVGSCLSAVGRSSSIAMYTMIPATKPKRMPYVFPEKDCLRTTHPTKAPKGSEIPESKAHQNPFHRLPVA